MKTKEKKEEEGSASSTSSVVEIAEQAPTPLFNVSFCKEAELKQVTGGSKQIKCLFCNNRVEVEAPTKEMFGSHINGDPRQAYMLCDTHYAAAYFGNDVTARARVEAAILKQVTPAYENAELTTLKLPSYADSSNNLSEVRGIVAQWAMDRFNDWWLGRRITESSASIYLYGDRNGNNTGNGCGKTHLAWAAYKHLARRTAGMNANHCDDHGNPLPCFRCNFIDIQDLVNRFREKESKDQKWYGYTDWNGDHQSGTFDDYLVNVASAPFLFIDDVGSGRYFTKIGDPSLAATTLEKIVDIRADNSLPTFYTSNYAPEELSARIGPRAASRVFRADCQSIRVKAPDYMMAKSKGRGKNTFKLMN